jgi:hypothetical protein
VEKAGMPTWSSHSGGLTVHPCTTLMPADAHPILGAFARHRFLSAATKCTRISRASKMLAIGSTLPGKSSCHADSMPNTVCGGFGFTIYVLVLFLVPTFTTGRTPAPEALSLQSQVPVLHSLATGFLEEPFPQEYHCMLQGFFRSGFSYGRQHNTAVTLNYAQYRKQKQGSWSSSS